MPSLAARVVVRAVSTFPLMPESTHTNTEPTLSTTESVLTAIATTASVEVMVIQFNDTIECLTAEITVVVLNCD